VALDKHTSLEYLTLLQLLPSVDSTDLNTDHVLVAIVGCEIAHGLRLLDPRVPCDGILDVVAGDIKAWLSILQDACSVDFDVFVHTVNLAVELEDWLCLCVGRRVEDLVDIFYAAETVD